MKTNLLLVPAFILILSTSAGAQLTYDRAFSLGLNINDMGNSITSDAAGNFYCTGSHEYWMDLDPLGSHFYIYNNGGTTYDIYVAKYSPQGILQWGFDIGGIGDDVPLKIKLDASNNVYITGSFNDTVDFNPAAGTDAHISKGGTDIFIAKYDNNGVFQWANTFGDSLDEQGKDIALDASTGKVIITGGYKSHSMDMDPGAGTQMIYNNGYAAFNTGNCFIASYDQATGAYNWAYNLGGYGGCTGFKVVSDNAGTVYLGGEVSGDSTDFGLGGTNGMVYCTSGTYKVFCAKYNSGALLWINAIGGAWGQTANSLAVDNDGNVYQGGYFNSDSMDFDPGPGTHYIHNYPNGVQDIYVVKYNSSGAFNWAFDVGGYYSEVAEDLVLDNAGHFFITGNFGDTVDFDPGPNTHYVYGNLGSDAYLAEYDTAGHFMNVISMIGSGSQFGLGVCIIPPNKVGVTGFFSADSVDFDPGPALHNLYVYGGSTTWTDAFVALYQYNPAGITEVKATGALTVFPNPATNLITVSWKQNTAVEEITITNILGETVYHSSDKINAGTFRTKIDCSALQSGIYFVVAKTKEGIETAKFIRQ